MLDKLMLIHFWLLLLIITFFGGFQGHYTRWSKIEAIIIGVLGTFIVNLLRMAITGVLAARGSQLVAIIFHDYFAALVFIIWLFVYWWFAYRFVLVNEDIANDERITANEGNELMNPNGREC